MIFRVENSLAEPTRVRIIDSAFVPQIEFVAIRVVKNTTHIRRVQ